MDESAPGRGAVGRDLGRGRRFTLLRSPRRGGRPTDFQVTAATLEALARANHFTELGGDRVLFGLRGCALVGQAWTELVSSLTLREVVPDHHHRRCVVGGVGPPERPHRRAVEGSTVPNAEYMGSTRTA